MDNTANGKSGFYEQLTPENAAMLLIDHQAGLFLGVHSIDQQILKNNAIAQMTPLRRIGVPEDIAGAVLLLASEQARFITGAYLPVNGGIFMP